MSTPREHPTGPSTDDHPPVDDRPTGGREPIDPTPARNGSRQRGVDGRFRPRETAEDELAVPGPAAGAASTGLEEVLDAPREQPTAAVRPASAPGLRLRLRLR